MASPPWNEGDATWYRAQESLRQQGQPRALVLLKWLWWWAEAEGGALRERGSAGGDLRQSPQMLLLSWQLVALAGGEGGGIGHKASVSGEREGGRDSCSASSTFAYYDQ